MNISKNHNNNNIIIALISFLLLMCIFKWINYLVANNYVKLSQVSVPRLGEAGLPNLFEV